MERVNCSEEVMLNKLGKFTNSTKLINNPIVKEVLGYYIIYHDPNTTKLSHLFPESVYNSIYNGKFFPIFYLKDVYDLLGISYTSDDAKKIYDIGVSMISLKNKEDIKEMYTLLYNGKIDGYNKKAETLKFNTNKRIEKRMLTTKIKKQKELEGKAPVKEESKEEEKYSATIRHNFNHYSGSSLIVRRKEFIKEFLLTLVSNGVSISEEDLSKDLNMDRSDIHRTLIGLENSFSFSQIEYICKKYNIPDAESMRLQILLLSTKKKSDNSGKFSENAKTYLANTPAAVFAVEKAAEKNLSYESWIDIINQYLRNN